MSKESKKTTVPKLRFPDFENAGGWNCVDGDKLFEPITNKKHNGDLPILAITQDYGAIPRDMIEYNVIATDKSIQSYKIVEIGDFIISLRSFQGGIEYSNYKGICSPAYIILRKKQDIEVHFYRHYFKTIQFIRDLNKNIEGIRDGKMVSYDQFSIIKIPAPKKIEQKKIADCLSSLDDVITAQTAKVEALKKYKKGLLQKLFPQEGETVPRLRFPEFKKAKDWESTPITEFAILLKGKGISKADIVPDGSQLCIRYGELYTIYGDIIDKVSSRTNLSTDNLFLSEGNEVLIPSSGETKEDIARASCLLHKGIALGSDLNIIKSKEDGRFLSYYINGSMKSKIAKISQGDAVVHLYISQLEKLSFYLPQMSEQQKIANCLSSLDDVITAQNKKVDQLKEHKKGLL